MTTIAELADRYGDLDAQIKGLQAEQKRIREKLSHYKTDTLTGTRFVITRSPTIRTTLDKDAVVLRLGEQWVAEHSKVTTSVRFTIKASVRPSDSQQDECQIQA